jgi:hypothetical protein
MHGYCSLGKRRRAASMRSMCDSLVSTHFYLTNIIFYFLRVSLFGISRVSSCYAHLFSISFETKIIVKGRKALNLKNDFIIF